MAYEKMPCLYDTEHDLTDRLGNTFCRYDGKVYRVRVETAKKLNLHHPISDKLLFQIKPSDPLFDISSPEIGYFNSGKVPDRNVSWRAVVYAQRQPYRRYRQGLNPDCLLMHGIDLRALTSGYYTELQGFIDSIEGKFPEFEEALSTLRVLTVREIAISRDIALTIDDAGMIQVYCKQVQIGWVFPGMSTVQFKESKYQWLFEKMGIKNHLVRTRGKYDYSF